jgi:hypothetical protein
VGAIPPTTDSFYHNTPQIKFIAMSEIQSENQDAKMPAPTTPPAHISINPEEAEGHDASKGSTTPKSSSGWDGKLRVDKEKKLVLVNPEAISDPEYSDEEQVLQGDSIEADEGISSQCPNVTTY